MSTKLRTPDCSYLGPKPWPWTRELVGSRGVRRRVRCLSPLSAGDPLRSGQLTAAAVPEIDGPEGDGVPALIAIKRQADRRRAHTQPRGSWPAAQSRDGTVDPAPERAGLDGVAVLPHHGRLATAGKIATPKLVARARPGPGRVPHRSPAPPSAASPRRRAPRPRRRDPPSQPRRLALQRQAGIAYRQTSTGNPS